MRNNWKVAVGSIDADSGLGGGAGGAVRQHDNF